MIGMYYGVKGESYERKTWMMKQSTVQRREKKKAQKPTVRRGAVV